MTQAPHGHGHAAGARAPRVDPASGGEHVTVVRVRYPEVDRMAVAHHMHYLAWFETGRTELMRAAGVPYAEVEERLGVMFPVIEVGVRYRAPARYDEELEIRTSVGFIEGPRVRFNYRIVRPEGGALLAEGFSVHAATNREGRPQRVPRGLKTALDTWGTP